MKVRITNELDGSLHIVHVSKSSEDVNKRVLFSLLEDYPGPFCLGGWKYEKIEVVLHDNP